MSSQEVESLVRRYNNNLVARKAATDALAEAQGLVQKEFPSMGLAGDENRWYWENFWRSFDLNRIVGFLTSVKSAKTEMHKLDAEAERLEACLEEQGIGEIIRRRG